MITRLIEQEITDRIKANYRVKELILFGSHAYGNPDEDSDIDLILILDEKGIAKKYVKSLIEELKYLNCF